MGNDHILTVCVQERVLLVRCLATCGWLGMVMVRKEGRGRLEWDKVERPRRNMEEQEDLVCETSTVPILKGTRRGRPQRRAIQAEAEQNGAVNVESDSVQHDSRNV